MHQHHSDSIPPHTDAPRSPRTGPPPFWMISIGLIAVVGSWLILVIAARARAASSNQPRVALFEDMGIQPKYREQQTSEVFADGRADRPRILGTVAKGQLHDDDHFYLGYAMAADPKTGKPAPSFFADFPSQVNVDEAFLKRGQERFNIYCSACHGLDGRGHGTVNEIALQLQQEDVPHARWTQVADLTSDPIKARLNGHIYNTINVGIRSMPSYGAQIAPEDRWAIVAYVRALQLTRDASAKLLSQEMKDKLSAPAK